MLEQERITKILESYKIVPRYMEHFGKVIKVYTPYGNYALKKYVSNNRSPVEMIQTVSNLFTRGFQNVAPIFRGVNGEYLVEDNQEYFYLMPWYDENSTTDQTHRYEQLFKQLSILHNKTLDVRGVAQDEIDQYSEGFRTQLRLVQERLDEHLEYCESKVYMSPSELQFCSLYFKSKQAIDFSEERLDKWEEWSNEVKESRSVMNHGDLSLKHYVVDRTGRGYFINFEKSYEASPVNDMLQVSKELLRGLPLHNETKWNWMNNYFSNFDWSKGERSLYMIHLSNPIELFQFTENVQRSQESERERTTQLQYIYWKMINSEYIVSKLLELEQSEEVKQSESS